MKSVPQDFPTAAIVEMGSHFARHRAKVHPGCFERIRWDVLVGKVDAGLEPSSGTDQSRSPSFIERSQLPLILTDGLPSLRLGIGIDQVGDGFCPGQIEPTVLHGTARELTGLGDAKSRHATKLVQHGLDHGWSAMKLNLNDILACVRVGCCEPDDQRFVENITGLVEYRSNRRLSFGLQWPP